MGEGATGINRGESNHEDNTTHLAVTLRKDKKSSTQSSGGGADTTHCSRVTKPIHRSLALHLVLPVCVA